MGDVEAADDKVRYKGIEPMSHVLEAKRVWMRNTVITAKA